MTDSRIVADGSDRAIKGASEQIAAVSKQIQLAVESEYATQLANAGRLRRAYLRLLIGREVNRRIAAEVEKIAPHDAFYIKQ